MNSVNVFGLDVGSKYYIHHYREFANVWGSDAFVTLLPSKSSMFPNKAINDIDFWTTDADFQYTCDQLSFDNIMSYGRNHFTYIGDFLKIYQIDYSLCEDISNIKLEMTKSKYHIHDILKNCILSDIILISPVMVEQFNNILSNFYSDTVCKQIISKYVIVPPPGYYKIQTDESKFKGLSQGLNFLWNHRIAKVKAPEVFFDIISKFHNTYPHVPISINTLTNDSLETIYSVAPENIRGFIKHYGFISDKTVYENILNIYNITINTARVEAFGISAFENIKAGILVLNLDYNKSFQYVIGNKTSFTEDEIINQIYQCYTDTEYCDRLHAINLQGVSSLPSKIEYINKIQQKMEPLFYERTKNAIKTKSTKIKNVVDNLEKVVMSKREVYNMFEWSDNGVNAPQFWANYYYTLRGLGVKSTKYDGEIYFYTGDFIPPEKDGFYSDENRNIIFRWP